MTEKYEKDEEITIFIEGDTIVLTPLKLDHVDLYVKWRNNPNVRVYARGVIPFTAEKIKKQLEPPDDRTTPTAIDFEIWHIKDKKPIGDSSIFSIDWFNRKAHIGMMLGEPEYWNQNLGTECTRLVVNYAFGELNLNKLYANIFSPNPSSMKCAVKNGFILEATLKGDIFIDGEYEDTFIYALTQKEWRRNI